MGLCDRIPVSNIKENECGEDLLNRWDGVKKKDQGKFRDLIIPSRDNRAFFF